MKAIGYIRVSTEEQAESGLSMSHQAAKIEAYCLAMDIELVAMIEDSGKSAKNLNRPGLQKALEMLKGKEAEALVILKLDRLTRSVKDLGALVELFEKTGAALVSVQDSINTRTAAGRLVLNVLGSVAQWEREAIGERTAAALHEKRRQGKLAGNIPYGFNLADDGETLIPNPQEKKALEIMQELRNRGLSLRTIARELESRGIKAKNGGKWHAKVISQIVEGVSHGC